MEILKKFNQFLHWCIYNKKEIKGSPKIRMKAKETSWKWNIKNNSMARYCHNSTFLEEVSFEQHEEIQITISLWIQFSETVAKTVEFLKLSGINFDTYSFVFFSNKLTILIWTCHQDFHHWSILLNFINSSYFE